MSKIKIFDQYTDRTDLTNAQKYLLRHLERSRLSKRNYQFLHLDEQLVRSAKWAKKQKCAKIDAALSGAKKAVVCGTSKLSASRRKEILRLHERGKDTATIAIYMNLPMSAITEVISQSPSN